MMMRLGLKMMLHDKLKFVGTVSGVVIAVVLSVQQVGVLLGLLAKNTMFVDHAQADIWIAPPGTELLNPGQPLPESVATRARVTPGVESVGHLAMGMGSVLKPGGGTEAVTIVGTELETGMGGPWNVVAGDVEALSLPDTVFFEDSRRDELGGLNLGSVREVNGSRVRVGGFTWGLNPFGPPYAFAELDLGRRLLRLGPDASSFVLVRVAPGQRPEEVARALAERIPEAKVLTASEFHDSIVGKLLREQLGVSFATSTAFALIVGFVIVALSMFSSVLDRLKEFGTLKAVGTTNGELALLLVTQSVAYAGLGSVAGLGLATLAARGIRSANLSVLTPPELVAVVVPVMLALCVVASLLAIARIRRVEPGMVFR
jgi:putative ABC transport system permease protein